MKHLVVYCHPYKKSFNHAIKETYVEALYAEGHDVRLKDLYQENFNPIMKASDLELIISGSMPEDIAAEQAHVRWAQLITFIHPTWWDGLPAMLKGYLERVFCVGFAYEEKQDQFRGLLAGKKMMLISTLGAPKEYYDETGKYEAMDKIYREWFAFIGMELVGHKYFWFVPYVSDEERARMLEKVKEIAHMLGKQGISYIE